MTTRLKIWAKRSLRYILYWGLSFLFHLRYFSGGEPLQLIDVLYSMLMHFSIVSVVLVYEQWVIPRYLSTSRWWFFLGSVIALLFVGVGLHSLTFAYVSDWIFPGFYFIALLDSLSFAYFLVMYGIISTILAFSDIWKKQQQQQQRISELEQSQKESELRVLRAQVNPHFLFNTLTLIYGSALKGSDHTAELILTLSGMLRYSLEQGKQEWTSLDREIEYITSYVQLQKHRVNHPDRIHFIVEGNSAGWKVPSLIFINMIENCFTYADISEPHQQIRCHLTVEESTLQFRTRNYRDESKVIQSSSGSGLKSTERRLQLLYGDHFKLTYYNDGDEFFLTLILQKK